MICVARVGAPVGIKGQLRLVAHVSDRELLTKNLLHYGENFERTCRLHIVGLQKNTLLVLIDGISDRTQAEKWTNTELYLPRNMLHSTLDEGEYYISDLVGMRVCDAGATLLGSVKAVHNFGAGDIIEIKYIDGREEMILFTHQNFPDINVQCRLITHHPPEIV
jgi:16S rRNA processing protein RimM